MKMTMQKSYFQCLAIATKSMSALERNVEKIFNPDVDTTHLQDIIIMDCFDTIECVQQELWLIVTSMPSNTFGKKAAVDIIPFDHMIRSMRVSLKIMTRTSVDTGALVGEFCRYKKTSKRLMDSCKKHGELVRPHNKHLAVFLTNFATKLQQQCNEMQECLNEWNGEEWSRGYFLEKAIRKRLKHTVCCIQ